MQIERVFRVLDLESRVRQVHRSVRPSSVAAGFRRTIEIALESPGHGEGLGTGVPDHRPRMAGDSPGMEAVPTLGYIKR